MLQTILVPVSIVTGTGLIAGLLLSIASKFFAVKVDETVASARSFAGSKLWRLWLRRL